MRECFRLALLGKGRVSPNPMVGALLVRDGKIIARGYHRTFGGPHAEAACLSKAGGRAKGATLYVNLEPCSHFGNTPPCVDAVVRAGVQRVVVAMRDPNPLVAGRGIRRLRSAGISVQTGILQNEAAELNRFFVRHITRRRPYVHLKIAQSLDGMIAAQRGRPRWLTSEASRRLVHQWRSEYDAVLVGAGTIRADNPRLTTRLVRGRNPSVVVLDGSLSIPLKSSVVRSARRRRVIVCTSIHAVEEHERRARQLEKVGVMLLPISGEGRRLSLGLVLTMLYKLKIGTILVEGGQTVNTSFLRERLADEISVFIAPLLLGSGITVLMSGTSLKNPLSGIPFSVRTVGHDLLMNFRNP